MDYSDLDPEFEAIPNGAYIRVRGMKNTVIYNRIDQDTWRNVHQRREVSHGAMRRIAAQFPWHRHQYPLL